MENLSTGRHRIKSIDVLRGLVMVIMALDHVRDFFYKINLETAGAAATGPTDLETTYPMLFFTRWITHFCAPIFVFLAGSSIYLMSRKKTKNELSMFLIKRGFWLVIVEVVIITLSWTFNPLYNLLILQVIWAIGVSMILLGILVQLPYKVIFAIGFIIVFGHNLLDYPSISSGLKGSVLADFLYFSNFSVHPIFKDHFIIIIYSFLPWTGVMLLGYCFGKLYTPGTDPAWRRKKLIQLGLGLLILFVLLRFSNLYGDPVAWTTQHRGPVYTFLSFLNVNKYPPSLLFLCVTIGTGILFLAFIEKVQNRFTAVMNIYGRVPMFYYILHFYLIHTLVVIVFYLQGFGNKDIVTPNVPFLFRPQAFGFNLWGVYVVWAFVVIVLYPLCKKYNAYKSTHQKWWLSYL
ncbi:MAG: heparan-alpha-glucosaminide N-acetyltransferase domain-containing protein [Ferruginibacter sp.]